MPARLMLPESAGSVVVVVLPKDGSASSSAASRVPETADDGSGVVTEGMTAAQVMHATIMLRGDLLKEERLAGNHP